MTSGTYLLTFSSGSTYIGKSANIETRLKQHWDKFKKGTASSSMQTEFNNYGKPKAEVLFSCHSDHIDIVEACFINRLKPNLNGTYPQDPFQGIQEQMYTELLGFLHQSTVEHVDNLVQLHLLYTVSKSSVSRLTEEIEILKLTRTKEELALDLNKRIELHASCIQEREQEIEKLISDNKALLEKLVPWWKKLFN